MVHPSVSRALDRWIDRGEGVDETVDPFGPPLAPDESERLVDSIRRARFAEHEPPFASPIALPDTSPRVGALFRAPRRGASWAVVALPYGGFYRPGMLGIYEIQARTLAGAGLGVAAIEAPYHGARAIAGQRSGWGFVRADLGHTARACAAYASEVAALARHLRDERGATSVMGLGISLGGNALGLAAALGAGLDRLGFLAAVDNPVSFYATGSNRERRRRTLAAAGLGMPDVAAAFEPFSPSSYAAPAPSYFAIPRHDLVVPAATQDAWRVAWGGELYDLGWEGHGFALASPRASRALARWLTHSRA